MVQLTHSIRTPLVAHASDRHADEPLVWGLTPQELHDAFWRSKGVQCVRRGQHQRLQRAAELFLLIEPEQLVLFNIARLSERLTWCDAETRAKPSRAAISAAAASCAGNR